VAGGAAIDPLTGEPPVDVPGSESDPVVFDSDIPGLDRIAAKLYNASWYYDQTGDVDRALADLSGAFDQAHGSGDSQETSALLTAELINALDAAAASLERTDIDGSEMLRQAIEALASNQVAAAEELIGEVVQWYPGEPRALPDG